MSRSRKEARLRRFSEGCGLDAPGGARAQQLGIEVKTRRPPKGNSIIASMAAEEFRAKPEGEARL